MSEFLFNILVTIAVTTYISVVGYYAITIWGWLKDLKEYEQLIEKYRAMLKETAVLYGVKWEDW